MNPRQPTSTHINPSQIFTTHFLDLLSVLEPTHNPLQGQRWALVRPVHFWNRIIPSNINPCQVTSDFPDHPDLRGPREVFAWPPNVIGDPIGETREEGGKEGSKEGRREM